MSPTRFLSGVTLRTCNWLCTFVCTACHKYGVFILKWCRCHFVFRLFAHLCFWFLWTSHVYASDRFAPFLWGRQLRDSENVQLADCCQRSQPHNPTRCCPRSLNAVRAHGMLSKLMKTATECFQSSAPGVFSGFVECYQSSPGVVRAHGVLSTECCSRSRQLSEITECFCMISSHHFIKFWVM